jgi:hypothetical protein
VVTSAYVAGLQAFFATGVEKVQGLKAQLHEKVMTGEHEEDDAPEERAKEVSKPEERGTARHDTTNDTTSTPSNLSVRSAGQANPVDARQTGGVCRSAASWSVSGLHRCVGCGCCLGLARPAIAPRSRSGRRWWRAGCRCRCTSHAAAAVAQAWPRRSAVGRRYRAARGRPASLASRPTRTRRHRHRAVQAVARPAAGGHAAQQGPAARHPVERVDAHPGRGG